MGGFEFFGSMRILIEMIPPTGQSIASASNEQEITPTLRFCLPMYVQVTGLMKYDKI